MEKKYSIQEIIGCLLLGIGDWLLGYVDPEEQIAGAVRFFDEKK